MSDVRVVLPLRLVSVSNAREHWAAKAGRTKAHRGAALMALRQPVRIAMTADRKASHVVRVLPDGPLAGTTVTLTRIAPRMLDDDNLAAACKATRDGVADALGVDDRDPRVTWSYGQRRAGKGEPKYGVEIVIRRA